MSQDIMIRPNEAAPMAAAYSAPAQPDGLPQMLWRYLRGRLHWAILLGLLLGVPAAYFGYKTGERTYTSRGLIRVAPVLPRVLFNTTETGVMPMYDSYVDAQVSFIKSQSVIDMAMNSDGWKKLARPYDDQAIKDFTDHLKVSRKGELLFVEFTDPEIEAARVGVTTVIDAYRKLYLEQEDKNGERRLELLEQRRSANENLYSGKRKQINDLSVRYGSEDLTPLYMAKLAEITEYNREIEALDRALAGRAAAAGPTTQPTRELTVQDIAWEDRTMAVLLSSKEDLERQVERWSKVWLDNNPRMIQLTEDLALATKKVEDYAVAYRERMKNRVAGEGIGAANASLPREELEARRALAMTARENAKGDLQKIGQDRVQILQWQDEAADYREKFEEAKRRIEQLTLEGALAGRVSVVSQGERPLAPSTDTHMSRAVMGGVGGLGFGIGFVILIGFLDRRLRFPEDASGANGVHRDLVLGVLPELPHDLEDPELAGLAVRCVHRIRTALQINYHGSAAMAFTVTSPLAGTGKTSLTLSLGMSFASSGSKTLLIDCDIIGRGLTSRLSASIRRKLGRLLVQRKLISEEQLSEGLRRAQASNRRLGEVLLEMGYVRRADLEGVLAMQQETLVGLVEALAGEDLRDCVMEAGVPNLDVLPLGNAEARHASTISPAGLRRVVEASREHYDIVLIDTGPYLGSLEAAAVASVSDGVVLIVSRGEHRTMAEKCVSQLNAVGAHLSGIVFNRARSTDVAEAYSSTASEEFRRTSSVPEQGAKVVNGRDIGSIASAVAASTPDDKM